MELDTPAQASVQAPGLGDLATSHIIGACRAGPHPYPAPRTWSWTVGLGRFQPAEGATVPTLWPPSRQRTGGGEHGTYSLINLNKGQGDLACVPLLWAGEGAQRPSQPETGFPPTISWGVSVTRSHPGFVGLAWRETPAMEQHQEGPKTPLPGAPALGPSGYLSKYK